MGPGFGNELAAVLGGFLALALLVAFALGALAWWGLPKLWDWLAPIIHAATA